MNYIYSGNVFMKTRGFGEEHYWNPGLGTEKGTAGPTFVTTNNLFRKVQLCPKRQAIEGLFRIEKRAREDEFGAM